MKKLAVSLTALPLTFPAKPITILPTFFFSYAAMYSRFYAPLLVCCLALLTTSSLYASGFSLTPGGIRVTLRGMDNIVFSYPQLLDGRQQALGKIIESRPDADGRNVVVRYDNGTEIRFAKRTDTRLELSVANPPAGLQSFRFEALVPFAMNEGGAFRVDQAALRQFPMQKPDRPHLYQGNASEFSLIAPNGESFVIGNLPPGTYLQIQDNREWSWPIFAAFFLAPFNRDQAAQTFEITARRAEGWATRRMVDRFGQDYSHEFAAKISSEEELKEDARTEQQYYDSLPKARRGTYGGFPGSGETLGLKKTGFFHVQKVDGRWHLVDPEGNAFFHLGVVGFQPSDDYTFTEGREDIFEWLPPQTGDFATAWHPDPDGYWNSRAVSFYVANYIRKFGKPYDHNEWAARMVDRVRALGFTSAGCFSATPNAFRQKNFPYVHIFNFWGVGFDIPGARGFFDPFNPEVARRIDERFARTIAPGANDPLIIGYYLANEQGVEDLPRALAALDGSFAAKRALVDFLREKYGSISAFNEAWGMRADSFDALLGQGLPISTRAANEDITEFVGIFLDTYYSLLHDTFRKYNQNHMLIGSRWQPGTANNEMLVRICAKYCDVISVNYYTMAFDRDYLDRLHYWSGGKPFLLSEWHYSCAASSGLPSGLGAVNSQRERGLAYRNYVEQAAATGYVVGIEWFTLIDQARSGRYFERNTGERGNTGIFAVTDRPWKDFVAEVIKTNVRIEDVVMGRVEPFFFDDPRFTRRGGGRQLVSAVWVETPLVIDGSRDSWPGVPPVMIGASRIAVGMGGEGFMAAFRAAWDEDNLYFFIDVTDTTPGRNERTGADLWQGDCIELFVGSENLDQPGNLISSDRQILIGAGNTGRQWYVRNVPSGVNAEIKRAVQLKADGSGYFLEAAIPFEILGVQPREGMELLFDVAVDDSEDGHERVRQFVWNGDDRVSNERGCWGKIRLTK